MGKGDEAMRRQHWVIPIANSMGYHPTSRQATRINCRSLAISMDRLGGNLPKEWLASDPDFQADLNAAIREVMNEPKKARMPRRVLEIVRI